MRSDEPPRQDDTASDSPSQAALLRGRLHPLTLGIVLVNTLRGLLIPALIVMFTGSERAFGILLFVFLGLGLIPTLIRYFTFTYRIESGELITRQGVLERTERHIPLARVQDVRFEQGIMHRMLKVVDVHIETAGGKGAEASLSVLSKADAEALRRAVFEQARVRSPESAGTPLASGDMIPTEVIRKLSTRELLLAGLTSNRILYPLTIILVAWQQLMDDILPKRTYERFTAFVGNFIERWVNAGDHPSWAGILVLAIVIILSGMVLSAVGSVLLFYGFTLSRRGEDLHRSYGLITRRASSLPRRRIQLLRIEATWMRRLLRLATLRADTAGSQPGEQQAGNEGRDVLVPVVRREEVDALLPVFLPNLDAAAPDWRQVSRTGDPPQHIEGCSRLRPFVRRDAVAGTGPRRPRRLRRSGRPRRPVRPLAVGVDSGRLRPEPP